MSKLRVVLFDVDGVLLDSLTPHLQICKDKNIEYGLGLDIPSADELRKLVRNNVNISPMYDFFVAVGFPREFAERAYIEYQQTFIQKYTITPFNEAYGTVVNIYRLGLSLGILTSNFISNITPALGEILSFFDRELIFTKDTQDSKSKGEKIKFLLDEFDIRSHELLYIGDLPSDWEAARFSGVNFLGVSYGWGISDSNNEYPVVNDISEIQPYIIENFV